MIARLNISKIIRRQEKDIFLSTKAVIETHVAVRGY